MRARFPKADPGLSLAHLVAAPCWQRVKELLPSYAEASDDMLDAILADAAAQALAALGLSSIRVVGSQIGQASAIKMIRSVMIKGIEALTDEMMAAADAANVVDEVLSSLDVSEQTRPWHDRAAYNLERMHSHGLRRAAEMEESAKTLLSLGVSPVMTRGTIQRQREAAGKGKA